jgi:hypothetical protein
MRNGERQVASINLALCPWQRQGTSMPRVLSDLAAERRAPGPGNRRSFQFSENTTLIRVEYGQKMRSFTNGRFKPAC